MTRSRTIRFVATAFFCAFIFLMFFNGYKTSGPARGKFKNLGEGTVDLTKPAETLPEEPDQLAPIAGNRRVKEWEAWWRKCIPGFSAATMENIGQAPIFGGEIPFIPKEKMHEGPGSVFYIRSPGGKYILNPYFDRLVYKKEADGWQPYVDLRCGAALYNVKEKRARNIIECTAFEGIDDAFWQNAERVVFMGYTSVSRQMNVECETVEACAVPTVWVVDLKTGLFSEWHSEMIKRKQCELGGYLKNKFPGFFGK